MLNDISVPRFNELLHRAFGAREGAPAPMLASEVFPTFDIEPHGPEYAWLRGVRLGWATSSFAALASNYNHFQVYVPTGTIAVIQDVVLVSTTAQTCVIGQYDPAPYPGFAEFYGKSRDGRPSWQSAAKRLSTTFSSLQSTTSQYGNSCYTFGIAANTPLIVPLECVLTPGHSLMFDIVTINVGTYFACRFYERAIEEQETR